VPDIRSLRESFWDARRNPLIFFGVAYLFALSSNLASSLDWFARYRWWFVLGVPALIAVVILSPLFRYFATQRVAEPRSTVHPAKRFKAVVVFASPKDGIKTAETALRFHELGHAWCFHSDTSRRDAVDLKSRLVKDRVVEDDQVRLVGLSDADFNDPESVKRAIEREVFAKLPEGLREEDVVIDITGGKKTTSVGGLLAGLPAGRRLEIVTALEQDDRGRGVVAGVPAEIDITYNLKRVRRR
jgi:hypothetical protein